MCIYIRDGESLTQTDRKGVPDGRSLSFPSRPCELIVFAAGRKRKTRENDDEREKGNAKEEEENLKCIFFSA